MSTTTAMKTKTNILNKHISNRDLESEFDVYLAMTEYAEQNSIGFSKWRSEQSTSIQNRYKLNRPLDEQYELFLKENGL